MWYNNKIADVSGKGVSAALFMVIAKTLIKNQAQQGLQDPADVFDHVNRKLIEVNDAHLFVTAWMGILELSTGELTYVNAGHEDPALRRGGAPFGLEVDDNHGVPLAARKKANYRSRTFHLDPGDTLYIYTDGVTEARTAQKEMFGLARLQEALNRQPDAAPEQIDRNVQESIDDFVQDAEQFDDTTMLCLKYNGPQAGAGDKTTSEE